MNNPLVSIITPCYNSENYLDRYLSNILEQTYPNIELIVINDGSTDSTESIVFKYVDIFKERGYCLKYIKQENTGLGGAINTGLKYITGEYFAWCDSDNFYTNDYVQKKIEFFINNPQYSIVRCDGYVVDSSDISTILSTMAKNNNNKFEENMFENCLFDKNFHFGCAMLKTKDFDSINPNREIYPSREGQNWQLLLPMFYHYKSGYIDRAMFYFVYRSDSVSNCTKGKSLESRYKQQEEYCNIILKTLQTMQIVECDNYSRMIKIKYSNVLIRMALNGYDREKVIHEYKKLKELGGLDIKARCYYFFGTTKIGYLIFSCLKRIYKVFQR